MKFKASFCKKALIWNNLRLYGLVFSVWGIYLFLAYPLRFIMEKGDHNTPLSQLSAVEQILFSSEFLLICIIPIAMGAAFYHFLKTDNGVAFYLSIPATRNEVYFSQMLSGFILYLTPLYLNALLVLGIAMVKWGGNIGALTVIGQWTLIMTLIFIIGYSVSIGMGMVTGSVVWHILFVFIFFLLPSYFSFAVDFFGRQLLYGFANGGRLTELLREIDLVDKLISRIAYSDSLRERWEIIGFLAIYAVAVSLAAFLLFRFKKMENNREWIGFGFLKFFFVFGFTLCSVIFMSSLVSGAIIRSAAGFYIGATIGATLGYIIAVMIAWKTIYLKKAWWGVLAAAALTLAVIGLIDADLLGYERRIPALNQIEIVEFGIHAHGVREKSSEELLLNLSAEKPRRDYSLQQQENIALVQALHQAMIEQRNSNSQGDNNFLIIYHLKSGETVTRRYWNTDVKDRASYEQLERSEEALRQKYPVLDDGEMQGLLKIKITTEASYEEESFSGAEMQELLQIVRRELLSAVNTPEEIPLREEGGQEVRLLKEMPIKVTLVEKYVRRQVLSGELEEALPVATVETRENKAEKESSLIFFGNAPELRRFLQARSAKYLKMLPSAKTIASIEFYRLEGFEAWQHYYWEHEMNDYEKQADQIITDGQEAMKYLALSGAPISLSYDEGEYVLLRIKQKDGSVYLRVMVVGDYERLKTKGK